MVRAALALLVAVGVIGGWIVNATLPEAAFEGFLLLALVPSAAWGLGELLLALYGAPGVPLRRRLMLDALQGTYLGRFFGLCLTAAVIGSLLGWAITSPWPAVEGNDGEDVAVMLSLGILFGGLAAPLIAWLGYGLLILPVVFLIGAYLPEPTGAAARRTRTWLAVVSREEAWGLLLVLWGATAFGILMVAHQERDDEGWIWWALLGAVPAMVLGVVATRLGVRRRGERGIVTPYDGGTRRWSRGAVISGLVRTDEERDDSFEAEAEREAQKRRRRERRERRQRARRGRR